MKLRRVHERFYRRKRPGTLIIICDAKGRILYNAWRAPGKKKK